MFLRGNCVLLLMKNCVSNFRCRHRSQLEEDVFVVLVRQDLLLVG